MDRTELVEALRAAGVPDAFYEVPGVPGLASAPAQVDASYFLRRDGDDWVVGLHERGQDRDVRRFGDEDAACRDLLDRLAPAPSPAPGPAAPLDELLADSEGIQRRAWEDFEGTEGRPEDEGDEGGRT
ncbi:hypothetical protein [Streptomyces tropicalis]|uniref:Aminoglycoside phosphotransferase n=1 Tax=Streptomyces tropicalis TaxID=3034234 RepID=A0ABT6A8N3_9ACTN|nr:hypothetical protein [Streptomyces tropicalis]MDF3300726.1 hypothetical protein [Streptomyces tropicalis]